MNSEIKSLLDGVELFTDTKVAKAPYDKTFLNCRIVSVNENGLYDIMVNGKRIKDMRATNTYKVGDIVKVIVPQNNNSLLYIEEQKAFDGIVPITQGGTGATNATDARSNLGLGSVATENIVPLDKGGTNASTVTQAKTNLEIPNIEQGTWTPILSNLNGKDCIYTSGEIVGVYYKIEKLVYISMYWRGKISSLNDGNYATVRNLPFVSDTRAGMAITLRDAYNSCTEAVPTMYVATNSSYIRVQSNSGAGATTWKTSTSDQYFSCSGVYLAQA